MKTTGTLALAALDGTARQVPSNSLGRFRLDSVAPGIYTVRVRAIGFAPTVRTEVVVSSGRPGELLVTLQERLVELEELEVTALTWFPPAADQPANTQQLGAEEVRRSRISSWWTTSKCPT
ncbi:MAG: carboxypeptidase-like regulatory domain-containing protein [Gemmatimonadota bacterium]|nr:carboxypeptidase-like regulatory domain-containing protein [Gemmatimonadota bacterium]